MDLSFGVGGLPARMAAYAGARRKLERSLAYHAEKKLLALALQHGDRDVTVFVNSKMCADCHSFFKHACQLFRATVVCVDGCNDIEAQSDAGLGGCGFRHVFGEDGTCSCHDSWR